MITTSPHEALDKPTAIQLIRSLKAGTAEWSPAATRFLHVGREDWLRGMRWYLRNCREANLSGLRLIKGNYGDGKSHFLYMTMAMALEDGEQGMVVSYITAAQTRLDKFEDVWKQVLQNLASARNHGAPAGIRGLLEPWCLSIGDRVPEELSELDKIPMLDPSFRTAIRLYVRAFFSGGDRDSIEQWLQGDRIRPPGIGRYIDKSNSHLMLRSLAMLLKHMGYGGLLILIDELERVMFQTFRVRNNAYETLRQIVDNANYTPGCLFLGACTPEMLSHPHGFSEYEALRQRLGIFGNVAAGMGTDYRGVVVDLDNAPLTKDEMVELASKIRHAHGIALDWDPLERIDDRMLSRMVDHLNAQHYDISKPRLLVEYLVSVLERAQQDPGYDPLSAIPEEMAGAAARAMEEEERRHRPWSDI